MRKVLSLKSIYTYILIAILFAAVAIRGGADIQQIVKKDKPVYTISDIQKVFPTASHISIDANKRITISDDNKRIIGYAISSIDFGSTEIGYAGPVPLLIALSTNEKIISVSLLQNNETGEFIDHINDKSILQKWDGETVTTEVLEIQVDAVSGATKSSNAIIVGFENTVSSYLELEENNRGEISVERAIHITLMMLLVVFSLIMVLGQKLKKYYNYYLLAVVIIMGFVLNIMLSLEQIYGWLSNGIPWKSNWESITIFALAIAMPILGKRTYYCNYLCPAGALQVLVAKLSPIKKRSITLKVSPVRVRSVYLAFIWGSLILGFSLPLAKMEPFIAFSFQIASWTMIISGIVIIVLSFFLNRPWCQFCPTGCLFDSIPSVKENIKNKGNEE